jgi:hypothetical protein
MPRHDTTDLLLDHLHCVRGEETRATRLLDRSASGAGLHGIGTQLRGHAMSIQTLRAPAVAHVDMNLHATLWFSLFGLMLSMALLPFYDVSGLAAMLALAG